MSKNRIIPQMFDVRPVDKTGDLNWQKISAVGTKKAAVQENVEFFGEVETKEAEKKLSANAYFLGVGVESSGLPVFHDREFDVHEVSGQVVQAAFDSFANRESQAELFYFQQQQQEAERVLLLEQKELEQAEREYLKKQQIQAALLAEHEKRELEKNQWLAQEQALQLEREAAVYQQLERRENEQTKISTLESIGFAIAKLKPAKKYPKTSFRKKAFNFGDIFSSEVHAFQFGWQKFVPAFAVVALFLLVGIGGASFVSKSFAVKGRVLGVSQDGYVNLTNAIADIKAQNFEGSTEQFSQAYENFSQASNDLEDIGGGLLDATRFLPFASKVSSGKNAVEAGKHFSAAGQSLNEVVKTFAQLKKASGQNLASDISFLEIFKTSEKNITLAKNELDEAQKNIDLILIDDLPIDKQQKFLLLKEKLPELRSMLEMFLGNSHIFVDLLGGNGPRKYLFLFQNNSEMRATGGFIGSYGLLDIANGHVKKFFIDGIFNPDGQLRDKIVPPAPIQKISAAWSLHDSNWFPDFPTSAQKAISFYEKTGGPTADGVISLTPTLMQKLLRITGPIEMPEYEVTLDADNFIQLTQYKVEVDYDKQENKPKKILSDLAPLLLEKLLSSKDLGSISATMQAFLDGLNEKHILLYAQDKELENIISNYGWSGKVLSTNKDYLSVINTNINGFKTDAVIEESIEHKAEIQSDGSIVDTVKITRKHGGGNSQYDWLNKVNANYLRVYVPKGSQLLEASGQTREINQPPLDYDSLGFKRDSDIQKEEKSISIDAASGTRIYEESGKTVFANWIYVSPQESVTLTYKYLLPIRLFQFRLENNSKVVDSYSLTVQKQSGSVGSALVSSVTYPAEYKTKWIFPKDLLDENNVLKNDAKLSVDYFGGAIFEK